MIIILKKNIYFYLFVKIKVSDIKLKIFGKKL